MLSKKEQSAQLLGKNSALFGCPHCGQPMDVIEQKTLRCANNHSFDLAKQGYVNMLTHNVRSMYDQSLFQARKEVINTMLYAQMYDAVVDNIKTPEKVIHILDTGCGEGTHLHKIKEQCTNEVVASGIDIAKEGIIEAAKNYNDCMWIVGDLAKSPYAADQFDIILNILSPANYDEFKRISKEGGQVMKVVPQSGYLHELRELYYADSDKEDYSNDKTVQRFKENFDDVSIIRVTKTYPLASELVPLLTHMTPMGWHRTEEIRAEQLQEITIDLDILIGTVKK